MLVGSVDTDKWLKRQKWSGAFRFSYSLDLPAWDVIPQLRRYGHIGIFGISFILFWGQCHLFLLFLSLRLGFGAGTDWWSNLPNLDLDSWGSSTSRDPLIIWKYRHATPSGGKTSGGVKATPQRSLFWGVSLWDCGWCKQKKKGNAWTAKASVKVRGKCLGHPCDPVGGWGQRTFPVRRESLRDAFNSPRPPQGSKSSLLS